MLELNVFTVIAYQNYLKTNNVKTSPNLHLMLHYSYAVTSPEHSQHFLGTFERISGGFQMFSESMHLRTRIERQRQHILTSLEFLHHGVRWSNPQSTYIYRAPQCMSPHWNWDSPTPLAASECALPPGPKGGGAHSPATKGVGESQFQRLEKRLALCLLCGAILHMKPVPSLACYLPVWCSDLTNVVTLGTRQ
jgi:hypothetical protein